MTRDIRYGIIGCGMMGQEHMRNIALLDGAHVGAIFEPDAAMAAEAQKIDPNAVLCATLEDLLGRDDLDCLLVVSPNHMHVPLLEVIAARNPLPLLMEKPLFTNPADEAKLMAFKESYPAPIWVAMEYRYMPPIQTFVDEVQKATGGVKMLTIREHRFPFLEKVGNWNRFNENSGGTLVEKCCHFFDLMRLIIGADPVRIMASAGQEVNHLEETYDGKASDIWDTAYVIVDFANGARGMLELSMYAEGSRFQEEISAVGPEGKIEALVPGPGRFWPEHLGAPPVSQVIVSPRSPKGPKMIEIPVDPTILDAGDHNGSTFYQHQKFLEVVRGAGEVEVSLMDGFKAVKIGMLAQDSARDGAAKTFG